MPFLIHAGHGHPDFSRCQPILPASPGGFLPKPKDPKKTMKHSNPISRSRATVLLAGLLLAPSGLNAAQLAYEGFDYPAGSGNLTGLNGGSGWNGVWRIVNNNPGDIVAASLSAATSPAGYNARSMGNSCNVLGGRRVGRKLDTSATGPFGALGIVNGSGQIGADGKTVYISFMQQPSAPEKYYEFEFHRGDLGDTGRIAGIGNDQAGTNVNLRAPNGTHTAVGPGNTNVNFYVVRIDFKAGNDDVYVYQNPTSLTEAGATVSLFKGNAADMSFDGVSLGAFDGTPARTVAHDEVRIGQTWEDVTIPVTAAPLVTRQPKASTVGYVGGTVILHADASGQPLPTYQWYKGVDPIIGQTGKDLTLSNLQSTDTGVYSWKATNGGGTATSSNATVTVNTAPAGLLVYDGFDYDAGIGRLPGNAGGIGWGSPWSFVDGNGTNVVSGSLAAGNNGPNGHDAQSTGNSNFTPNAQRDGRFVNTAVGSRLQAAGYVDGLGNVGADGKTLYISFLQQPNGTTLFYEFEFHRGNLGDSGRIGGIGNDTNNPTVSLRTGGGTPTLIGPGSTGVNLYVIRIDYKLGNDDVYVYQNPVSSTEPGTPTLFKGNASDMSFNGISFGAFVNGRTVTHDEIRLGQTWSDVIFGTSRRDLTWKGNGTTNQWNLSAANWDAGSGPTAFVTGDPVHFDDTGSDTPSIDVTASVSTASITATNATKNYTLGGTGTVITSGPLNKSGAGAFNLAGPSNFSGSLVVSGGSFGLNGTATVGGNINLNTGTVAATLGGTNNISGIVFANSGTLALSGTNGFSGLSVTNSTVTISGPTNIVGTGGTTVFFGNLAGANSTVNINAGANVSMTGVFNDALVFGRDGGSATVTQNGGTFTYNPSNRNEAFIGASASGATTASYTMNGGTLDMTGKRLGLSIGPITSTLTQTGGTINVRQLDLGANLATGNGIYNLTGGTMNIGGGGITSFSNIYQLNLGGGTIGATAEWLTPLAINLTGTNGSTTFNAPGVIVALNGDITGTGGIIKTGDGVLNLNGTANAYSGTTLVNEGTLAGLGNSSSAVTVASGATLSPGDFSVATFKAASTTLAAGSTFTVQVDSLTTTADQLLATGAVGLNNAILSVDDFNFETLPPGTSFTIVSAASVTGTFADYPQGAEVIIGANSFAINYTSTQVKLTMAGGGGNAYQTWASGAGLDGSPGKNPAFSADPDGDGIANGLEWVLGGNPLGQDGGTLVTPSRNGNGLLVSFKREEDSVGLANVIVEWSNSLTGTWTEVPITLAGGPAANGVIVTVNQAPDPDTVTVEIPSSNALNGKLFARIRAILP